MFTFEVQSQHCFTEFTASDQQQCYDGFNDEHWAVMIVQAYNTVSMSQYSGAKIKLIGYYPGCRQLKRQWLWFSIGDS